MALVNHSLTQTPFFPLRQLSVLTYTLPLHCKERACSRFDWSRFHSPVYYLTQSYIVASLWRFHIPYTRTPPLCS